MTIYGEFDSQFRKKPALWRMLLISLSAAVVSSILVSAYIGIAIAAAGRSHNPEGAAWVFYAPPVMLSGFLFESASATLRLFPIAVSGGALLIGTILSFFWPGKSTLATQIFLGVQAVGFLALGAIAPAAAALLMRMERIRSWRDVLIEGTIILIALVLLVATERKTVGMLANLVPVHSPSRRFGLWLVRQAVPFGFLAAVALAAGGVATALAVAAMLAVTLLENLARTPASRFQQLRDVEMREAAASLPILAALLAAGSVWLFGLAPFRPDRAVIYQRGGSPELGSLEEARQAGSLERPLPRESVIKIRWSKSRD
jgi:hypothetical protein